jgi:integrase/recombinase XerD
MPAALRVTPSLYSRDGRRKYLSPTERSRFIAAAAAWPCTSDGTFCLVLAFTGCRISEALALEGHCFDPSEQLVAIRSLKKRGKLLVREIPLPTDLIERVHGSAAERERLWGFSRCRAWLLVKAVMASAGIGGGIHACPKGLRHGFGVQAIRVGVPLPMVQRWLGHASLATTAIYTQAMGAEEREIAARMWQAP